MKELPNDEMQLILEVVAAAGFQPKRIVLGRLTGDYLEQDGSRTGKTYPINVLCPFKVISQAGYDHYFATGWLDCLLRLALYVNAELRDRNIDAIRIEIARSIPMSPIQLTPEGDFLREYPVRAKEFGFNYFVDHTRDDQELGICVGVHDYCGGWMDRHRATATHDAIVCRKCNLRILFPKAIKTYGDLRKELVNKLSSVPGGAP